MNVIIKKKDAQEKKYFPMIEAPENVLLGYSGGMCLYLKIRDRVIRFGNDVMIYNLSDFSNGDTKYFVSDEQVTIVN